jgi:hypothetical protein
MISGQVLLLADGMYAWGDGAEGDTLVWQNTGLMLNGLTLFRLVPAPGAGGRWEPVTNGDPENPELVFYEGDVVLYFVAD